MHWKRKLITKPIKPKSPNLVRWLFAFIVVLFVLFGLIYVSSQYGFLPFLSVNSLQVLLYFLGAYLLSFLVRLVVFFNKKAGFLFLLKEKELSDQQWHIWGDRGLGIIKHISFLPNRFDCNPIIDSSYLNEEFFNGIAKNIDYLDLKDLNAVFIGLLNAVKKDIEKFDFNPCIDVIVLTDIHLKTSVKEFNRAWSDVNIGNCNLNSVQALGVFDYASLDNWITEGNTNIKLVLVLQTRGLGSYSDGLSVFLMATDDFCNKYKIPNLVELKRPNVVKDNFTTKDLDVFFATQTKAKLCNTIFINDADMNKQVTELLTYAYTEDISFDLNSVYILEQFIGITGPLSYWFTAGLALNLSMVNKKPVLIMTKQNNVIVLQTASIKELA